MKRTAPILALIFVIAIGFWVVSGFTDTSPGPLSRVHARVTELQGTDSCELCHGTSGTSMAQACNDCHEVIGDQLTQARGFHGTLPAAQKQDCGHCHLEHLGANYPLSGERAFQKAGWTEQAGFAHEHLDFKLLGRHLELECKDCHKQAEASQLETGQHRFIGLQQDCTPCHEDPHKGKAPDCNACHGQEEPFEAVALFEHDVRFPLTGGHAGIGCNDCHASGDYSANIDAVSERAQSELRACTACHESPHSSAFVANIAAHESTSSDQTCVLCHSIEDEALDNPDLEKTLALHDLTGFSLTEPHAEVTCTACHKGLESSSSPTADYASRFPLRSPEACERCHGDPHEGQFLDTRAGRPRGAGKTQDLSKAACTSCHHQTEFSPHSFTFRRHAETAFPLHGAHETTRCEACHKTRAGSVDPDRYPEVKQFAGTQTECADCHESPHAEQFSPGLFEADKCLSCHGQDSFLPAQFTVEMHARTRFPIVGAHLAVACQDCHDQKQGTDPKTNKTVDRVYLGTKDKCSACHLDVHDGSFDRRGIPAEFASKTSCQRCHNQESFAFADKRTFRHGFWTGFQLLGKHKQADCSDCHAPGQASHAGSRTMGKAKPLCADCHSDPHSGQFKQKSQLKQRGRTDCGRCHSATDKGWNAKRFTHNKGTRFALDEDHRGLACSKCHKTYRLQKGASLIRYRPLGITCKDCHGWEGKR